MDFIYALPVLKKWLLHAPLHGLSALVNAQTLRELKRQRFSTPETENLSQTLQHTPANQPPLNGPLNPEFLGIIPTRACNLNCVYCGFHSDSSPNAHMDLSLAGSAVEWMAEHVSRSGRDRLDIHFFGGEPFWAPDVVDVVVHKALALASKYGLMAHFEADTNGFFDETRCRFVGDYIHSVVLSFDGPEEFHNKHRPTIQNKGSYGVVARNASYLSQANCELSFRVCVTQKNAPHLEEITKWFSRHFHPTIINFEPLKETAESLKAGLKPPEPHVFAKNFMKAFLAASRLGIKAIYSGAMVEKIQHSSCPVGRDALILTPDGIVNACYLLEEEWLSKQLDLKLGYVSGSGELVIDPVAMKNIRGIAHQKNRCQYCFARWHCAGGCHVMNYHDNQTGIYTDFCIQTRLISAGLILHELGADQDLELLLQDEEAMHHLVMFKSDGLLTMAVP